jgi:hypothetical protein
MPFHLYVVSNLPPEMLFTLPFLACTFGLYLTFACAHGRTLQSTSFAGSRSSAAVRLSCHEVHSFASVILTSSLARLLTAPDVSYVLILSWSCTLLCVLSISQPANRNVTCRCSQPTTAREQEKSLTLFSLLPLLQLACRSPPPSLHFSAHPCTCPCQRSCTLRLLHVPSVAFTVSGPPFVPKTATRQGIWLSFGCWSPRRVIVSCSSV